MFRAYLSAQNFHFAAAIRATGRNEQARINAMRFIEQIDDERVVSAQQSAPGVVIIIGAPPAQVSRTIHTTANDINVLEPNERS